MVVAIAGGHQTGINGPLDRGVTATHRPITPGACPEHRQRGGGLRASGIVDDVLPDDFHAATDTRRSLTHAPNIEHVDKVECLEWPPLTGETATARRVAGDNAGRRQPGGPADIRSVAATIRCVTFLEKIAERGRKRETLVAEAQTAIAEVTTASRAAALAFGAVALVAIVALALALRANLRSSS